MKDIIERLSKIESGFKPIEVEALNIFKSKTIDDAITLSCELLKHEKYQIRSLAVFILGFGQAVHISRIIQKLQSN